MNDFFMHYGVCIILCVIGLFFVTETYLSRKTTSSGVPFVGGILIALGFLTTPHKWLALLGMIDPGWFMPFYAIWDDRQYHKAAAQFVAFVSAHSFAESAADQSRVLLITIPERKEIIDHWKYQTNHVYLLHIPRVYFAACTDAEGKSVLAYSTDAETIRLLSFADGAVTLPEIKGMTVTIEIKENSR